MFCLYGVPHLCSVHGGQKRNLTCEQPLQAWECILHLLDKEGGWTDKDPFIQTSHFKFVQYNQHPIMSYNLN